MNAMHSSMKITDEFYSNVNDGEVQNRIDSLGQDRQSGTDNQEIEGLFKDFIRWRKNRSWKSCYSKPKYGRKYFYKKEEIDNGFNMITPLW